MSMKRQRTIATLADLLVLALVVVLNPLNPLYEARLTPPRMPDKVEVRYHPLTATDSLTVAHMQTQLDELGYYLRVHNVTDEGYGMVAQYHHTLQQKAWRASLASMSPGQQPPETVRIAAKDRPLVGVKVGRGYWKAGRFLVGRLNGKAITRDGQGRIVSALWQQDTVVCAIRQDSLGTYRGQMDRHLQACGLGTMDLGDGTHQEGFWQHDLLDGFAFSCSSHEPMHVGEWKEGRFLGERMKYTAERIYGIDISRHQHEKGRRRYAIDFSRLRITSLGRRHDAQGRTFPVSFLYIKSTEGTTIRNRYFLSDYAKAKRQGIRVGAYHFFSLKSSAELQARYFVNHTLFRQGDFPPVLDVEPTDADIRRIGGDEVLMRRIRVFLQYVERRTGMRPILYVSQTFINRHMRSAHDIKQRYNVWIARYGQYKPDVRLVYWQLAADGRVDGIQGDVDINVFNGYAPQFSAFVKSGVHR